MNKIEEIKAEKPGLDVGADIERYARDGWQSIPEDDRDTRLKWWGVFYRKQTPGYFMMRIRIPNGIATAEQIAEIGAIARELGRDTLDLTTRQQVQLRWVRIEDVPAILERLRLVGLVSLQTGMDNLRNVIGCPAAGLTPGELFDASPVARAFNDLFVGNRAFADLPRKFNVAITGCLHNCTHNESQDVALVPATATVRGQLEHGFNVLAGGKMGSGGFRIAEPLDVFVRPAEAPALLQEIVFTFRDHGARESRNHARLSFLLEEWGVPRFRAHLERRLRVLLQPAGEDARLAEHTDHVGVWRQRERNLSYVGLVVPVGRASGKQFIQLARLAEVYGSGEVRLTPEQNAIIPNVHDHDLPGLLEEPLLKALRPDPSGVARGTVSCTGKDFCARSLIETKEHAAGLIKALEKTGAGSRQFSVNWSGCPAACGNHQAADIGLLGRRTKVDGEVIDAVDVFIGGSTGPGATPGLRVLENVPCSDLPRLAEFLVRYGDFKALRQQLRSLAPATEAPVESPRPAAISA